MEVRGVKFNLKHFCEDFTYAVNSNNDEDVSELELKLTTFLSRSDNKLKNSVLQYLLKSDEVKSNKKFFNFINTFSK